MSHENKLGATLIACVAFGACTSAHAVITPITPVDTPDCDVLSLPSIVDELGYIGFFPFDEAIDSSGIMTTTLSACPATDNPGIPNVLMTLGNFTSSTSWTNVHYVADMETSISNDDGLVNGGLAFKFDAVGIN